MTDNEIIKALECCKNEGIETCRDCPLFQTLEFDDVDDFDCGKYLYERAIDLINRQKAEIERAERNFTAVKVDVKLKNKEIERLQKERQLINEDLTNALTKMRALREDVKIAKSEAIKEFAKRLEDLSTERLLYEGYGETKLENIIICTDVDNLLKEMEGK